MGFAPKAYPKVGFCLGPSLGLDGVSTSVDHTIGDLVAGRVGGSHTAAEIGEGKAERLVGVECSNWGVAAKPGAGCAYISQSGNIGWWQRHYSASLLDGSLAAYAGRKLPGG